MRLIYHEYVGTLPVYILYFSFFVVIADDKYKNMTNTSNLYSIVTQNPWGWGRDLTEEDVKRIKEKSEQFYLNGECTENATMSDKCDV